MKDTLIKAFFMVLIATCSISAASYCQSKQLPATSKNPSIQPNISRDYFIYLDNINTRQDVLDIESLIQKKPGVSYFMAERFPVRCFVMRTDNEVSKEAFQNWIGQKYAVVTFGKGSLAREQAYLQYKRNRKKTH